MGLSEGVAGYPQDKEKSQKMSEIVKCPRCGKEDHCGDMRTHWMACMYAMDELDVPFEQVSIHGKYLKKTGEEKLFAGANMMVPTFEDPNDYDIAKQEPRHHRFFTLRVCKDCRADWMNAIQKWWHNVDSHDSTGTGVFVRENGTNRELTEEEVRQRWPNSG